MKFYEVLIKYEYGGSGIYNEKDSEIKIITSQFDKLVNSTRYNSSIRNYLAEINKTFIKNANADNSSFAYMMSESEIRIIIRMNNNFENSIEEYIRDILKTLSSFGDITISNGWEDDSEGAIEYNNEE